MHYILQLQHYLLTKQQSRRFTYQNFTINEIFLMNFVYFQRNNQRLLYSDSCIILDKIRDIKLTLYCVIQILVFFGIFACKIVFYAAFLKFCDSDCETYANGSVLQNCILCV